MLEAATERRHAERVATTLWCLTGLFFFRVLGQMLVAFAHVRFLPHMAEWYSGLMPYPLLLPTQLVMLAGMAWLNWGVMSGDGPVAAHRPRLGQGLIILAVLYAAGMMARYFISGSLHPERQWWPPGIIPIIFHFVLAGYLFTLGHWFARPQYADDEATE